ncbi:ABC transporter permease [Aureimonas sp. Leaf454]|uniref:TRAP transporter large permease n=1 Tax=Aureimonas sp. Leaf454 TaxID=1736381 RepID=UPI0006F96F31|nr:TRAP transporter large permease subunit [Aureimonas sp. Leaf454]KQT54751.1 ABC transporter permease [Aureimonas sp. Leaf454]
MTRGPDPVGDRTLGVRGAGRARTFLQTVLRAVCGLLLALLLLDVMAAVALRYGFGSGLFGAEEAALWLFLALIAFGAPLALDGPLAMRFDVAVAQWPGVARAYADALADAVVVSSAGVLIAGGSEAALQIGGLSPALGLPEGLRFVLFAIAGGTTLLALALRRLDERRSGTLVAALLLAAAIGGALHASAPHLDIAPSLVAALVAAGGLLVGAPLPHVLFAAAFAAAPFGGVLPGAALVANAMSGASKFLLLAVPFFLLVGGLLAASGAATALVRLASALVGHTRGGLAQTTLLTSVLFSGASGSSIANAAFGARTFVPELVRRGTRPAEAGAIIAATSTLDNVIPPSIAFLLLASATDLSIGGLLVGGFAAGGVMALALAVAIRLRARDSVPEPRACAAERRTAFAGALPAFGLGIIVVAGIRFGIVTTTEAAALAAAYTLCLALVAGIGWRGVADAFAQAGAEAAAIGLLIAASAPFAFLLAVDDVAGAVAGWARMLGEGPVGVLLACNLVLIAAGLVLDIGAAILLLGPILVPLAVAAGLDGTDFGVILVVNLMIGGLTPPVGILVYVVASVTGLPPAALFRAVLPYLAALLTALALLCMGAALRA